MIDWRSFSIGFSVGGFVIGLIFVITSVTSETPEQKHARIVRETQYMIQLAPVLRAINGEDKND